MSSEEFVSPPKKPVKMRTEHLQNMKRKLDENEEEEENDETGIILKPCQQISTKTGKRFKPVFGQNVGSKMKTGGMKAGENSTNTAAKDCETRVQLKKINQGSKPKTLTVFEALAKSNKSTKSHSNSKENTKPRKSASKPPTEVPSFSTQLIANTSAMSIQDLGFVQVQKPPASSKVLFLITFLFMQLLVTPNCFHN